MALWPVSAFSQQCNCEEIFAWTKRTFEENDAGFAYTLEKKGAQSYAFHNEIMEGRVKEIDHPVDCQNIIRNWLAFFREGHVEFHYLGETEESPDPIAGPETAPEDPGEGNGLYNKFLNAVDPFLESVDDQTLYLRVPSFRWSEKSKIDALLESHRNELLQTENLIIDIRDGTGGSDAAFEEIIPLLYTNPIRTPGVAFLSTELNNQRMYELATNTGIALEFGIHSTPEEMKAYRAHYDTLSNHLGEFVHLNQEKVSITTYDSVYAFPKNVGILINENNASSDEQFLLAARQSKKVKLFGTRTKGALDVSNLYLAYPPEKDFVLVYALSRSLRIPKFSIDDVGIKADFYIDEEIPKSQWIDYVVSVLNK